MIAMYVIAHSRVTSKLIETRVPAVVKQAALPTTASVYALIHSLPHFPLTDDHQSSGRRTGGGLGADDTFGDPSNTGGRGAQNTEYGGFTQCQ